MEFQWIWKAILIVFIGTMLLRLGGRKSISQMTVAQTVIMISIGTLLIQPVSEKNVWVTFLIAGLLIATLITMEYLQLKFDKFENLITGKAVMVIENGILNEKQLKKVRLTVDQLEMRLRQHNISKISDVKWATIETSGQLGFELKDAFKPATKGDLDKILQLLNSTYPMQAQPLSSQQPPQMQADLFTEVNQQGNHQEPKHLQ
ncbi:DUF421 domain-containing protein [Bacillus taeanensis]|uniref:DUF421 domain-containing protein n=1 Tax=Bacillus taeanensis TaxID=273032 RepID=A0A366XR23_9BACI|nr:DUF421 domain-containing protein [Bacillus taeanensis]RBW68156.1 DUF421 domain-containing protein [Bacillus taeanensis]